MGYRSRGLRRGLLSVGLLACLGSLTVCSNPTVPLEIPVSDWPGYEYFYLAQQSGLDRQEGLAIRTVQLPDPQAVINGFARGQFAVAQLSAAEVLDLCEQAPDRCPVVVLVTDASEGGDQLMVHNSVPSIEALRGRRVAVTLSTLGPYVLHLALHRHGLTLGDVQTLHIPLERMEAELAQGRVQAAATYPPFSETIRRAGHSRVLFTSAETPGEILDLLVVDRAFLKRQPRQVAQLLRVWDRAHQRARSHPQTSVAVMARREGQTPEAFRQSEAGLRYSSLQEQQALLQPGGAVERNLRQVQTVLRNLGVSPAGSPRPAVSDAPLQSVLQGSR
jgi:NitT/TauT family transport system substrate-binding protein